MHIEFDTDDWSEPSSMELPQSRGYFADQFEVHSFFLKLVIQPLDTHDILEQEQF